MSGWITRLNDAMIDNYTASGAWRNESIADIAARLVIEKPDMLAFIEGDRSLYLGNLVTKARKIAAVLATRGLVPGDVVSFQLPNWLETAVINLACCIGGFVCNPIIPIYREAEVGYILRDGRAKILFVPTSFRGFDYVNMARALQAGLPDLATIVTVRGEAEGCLGYEELLASNAPDVASGHPDPNAVKLLLYTSGTTSHPKGVLHSHNSLMAELLAARDYWGLGASDVVLMPSPVTHITGYLYALEMGFVTGCAAVLMERWDASEAVELIKRHGVTMSVGATPFLRELTDTVVSAGALLPTMRLFICGGAPVAPELVRRAAQAIPGCAISRAFGSSEAPTVTLGVRGVEELELGATTDGRIVNNEVRIIDEATGALLGEGAEGEILVRGPEVMLGYTDQALTDDAFDQDGFFRTGDLGRIELAISWR
ncbi:AMP-binding protein [Rhizorhabdus histidinilytica]